MQRNPRKSAVTAPARRGFLLVVVLVVIVLASLVCYQLSERMTTERQIVSTYQKGAQATQAALSGVDYMLAWMSDASFSPLDFANMPASDYAWQLLQSGPETGEQSDALHVVLVSREQTLRKGELTFGASAEGGKINLNGLVELDVPEDQQREILMTLPGMTDTLADTILDFIDADTTPREYGTESDQGSYVVRNGPLTSLDDLLQIPDITPALLYGEDANRNGLLDTAEDDGPLREPFDNADGVLDLGWSNWLTVWSRESNLRSDGTPKINVNADDLETLRQELEAEFGADVANFIVSYRQNGPTSETVEQSSGGGTSGSGSGGSAGNRSGSSGSGSSSSGSRSGGTSSGGGRSGGGSARSGGNSGGSSAPVVEETGAGTGDVVVGEGTGSVPVEGGSSPVSGGGSSSSGGGISGGSSSGGSRSGGSGSSSRSMTGGTGGAGGAGRAGTSTRVGSSNTTGGQSAQIRVVSLYELVDAITIDSLAEEPNTVLRSPWTVTDLTFLEQMEETLTVDDAEIRVGRIDINFAPQESLAGLPNITSAMIDEIQNGAGTWRSVGELLEKGTVNLETLIELEPFLTTRCETYRFTSIGLWQSGGPVVRMEAVIDTAGPAPVILQLENLSPLGTGYSREDLLPTDSLPANAGTAAVATSP